MRSRSAGSTLRAALIYTLAAGVFTWPLVFHLRSLFGAADPGGDPSLNLWILGWDLQTISTHPAWLLTGRVFNANIFFPAPHTLAYSDHLLPQALALWPLYWATQDLVLCYNVLLIASLVASALAMHLLARTVIGAAEGPAYAAGLIFGFAPYHFTHLTHIQLQALYFLPLGFLFLHRVLAGGRRRDTVGLGIVLGLQAVSSAYYGIIGAVGVAGAAVVLAILGGRWRDWRLLRRGLAAAAVAVLVALPWSIPYLQVQREAAAGRNLFEAARASAVPASYLQAPPTNLLYGRSGWLQPGPGARLRRKEGPEQALFPGFLTLVLAALGAALPPRPLRKTAAAYVLVGMAGFVLSLGPDGIRSLYSALYSLLFGMQAIRASARFSVLALAAMAVLSAMAVARWESRGRPPGGRLPWLTRGALALVCLEFLNGAIAFPPAPALTSETGTWLAAQPGSGAVVCLPMGLDRENTPCMLQSLQHGRPILNGYSGIRPPFFPAVVDAMSQMPSADALQSLHDLQVEYVATERPLDVAAPLADAIVERARFGDARVYQLVWSPATLAIITADRNPPPPEPGAPAFAVGESATYSVRWTSGPMNVPAGEMTIAVEPPRAGAAFRFVASARTAPWVARFFEADARLETDASARLLPIEHVETIVEGKRRIDRQLTFDFANRQVRMTNGGVSVTLPLATDARDPITAFFYVRTLPLAPAAQFSLPLTDNGRSSRLEVVVGPVETILVAGRPWSAWKVEPRLHERIEREGRLSMTTWISADERRLPLLIDITAAFGTVRAELTGYRER